MEQININDKMKMYLDLKKDIDTLTEQQQVIRKEIEEYFKVQGIDNLRTDLGSISYVSKEYESINKEMFNKLLSEEIKQQIMTKKESKYIAIRENIKKEKVKE
ncbi:MAG: hypothetical protein EOL97_11115 [Spirochaetia bacterium]|nr:hypothetical protein [Spirochaetia bacterium]